jgi:hypothetical protein
MANGYNLPNLTFADAALTDIIVDMRQRVDWGTFVITAKVDSNADYQKNYIEATSLVTGSVIRIPQIDFWARKVN